MSSQKSHRLLATAFQLITLGLAGHFGLGDCRPPIGPVLTLHQITVFVCDKRIAVILRIIRV